VAEEVAAAVGSGDPAGVVGVGSTATQASRSAGSSKAAPTHGNRVVGRDAVRRAFADRFAGIPDVRYTDDSHVVAGDRGVSE
jgi:hypothetical protein